MELHWNSLASCWNYTGIALGQALERIRRCHSTEILVAEMSNSGAEVCFNLAGMRPGSVMKGWNFGGI